MEERLLASVKTYLTGKYHCHSIILYGSFASGSETRESDIDMVCFCENTEAQNDTAIIDGWQLDAWIYDTGMMQSADELLRIHEGQILLDERNLCEPLLKSINESLNQDVNAQTVKQIEFQKTWLVKMLKRAKKEDIEGNFRYHWLLYDSLEIYFVIKRLRYRGPKNSLCWIKENDPIAYEIFEQALKISAPFAAAEKLVSFIAELDS